MIPRPAAAGGACEVADAHPGPWRPRPGFQDDGRAKLRVEVEGAVQGVGFRPLVFRVAEEHSLTGWIRNTPAGVELEMEGARSSLGALLQTLRHAPPARAVVREVRETWEEATGLRGLRILPSKEGGERTAAVLPDLATCDACLADIGLLPAPGPETDRRRGYAFTNCTDCGPRFSIVRSLPYDRCHTTMAGFDLCPACHEEYENPADRRFHAQPTACPRCGPTLWLERTPPGVRAESGGAWALDGSLEEVPDDGVIGAAAAAVRRGAILAMKGLGGFHLVADATDPEVVARLRARKHRPGKPLAVMVTGVDMAGRYGHVSADVRALLLSPEAPIVLLRRIGYEGTHGRTVGRPLAEGVAPGNPYLGVMLPYTPLHHLFMAEMDRPVIATSGNRSDEPICIREDEARERLAGVADLFLLHDRPIERPVDDSVVHVVAGVARPIRRSRGYAPLPVRVREAGPPILAVGAHVKNTIALSRGRDVFLSQHIGDLETPEAQRTFERVIGDFLRLYEVTPVGIAHDLHPDYAATRWAEAEVSLRRARGDSVPALIGVQHHHAHLAACLADNDETRESLGVVWDGSGLGTDGTIWGGEFLLGTAAAYRRVARFRPFRLPGGDAAMREPRRVALAMLWAARGEDGIEGLERSGAAGAFEDRELSVIGRMLETGFNAPWTTSAGRLFDGVASLLGLRQRVDFEGEAAMALEWIVDEAERGAYRLDVTEIGSVPPGDRALPVDGGLELDWRPALDRLLLDFEAGVPVETLAARFHNGLAEAILEVAERVGRERVALTGGCFQNRMLSERAASLLHSRGFAPLLHRQVPANDGGLALGQVMVATANLPTAPDPES